MVKTKAKKVVKKSNPVLSAAGKKGNSKKKLMKVMRDRK